MSDTRKLHSSASSTSKSTWATDRPNRRTSRACDRCRTKKAKCDGITPCKTCVVSDSKCAYATCTSREARQYYVHARKVTEEAIQRLYHAACNRTGFPGAPLPPSNTRPTTNAILERLGLLGPFALNDAVREVRGTPDAERYYHHHTMRLVHEPPPLDCVNRATTIASPTWHHLPARHVSSPSGSAREPRSPVEAHNGMDMVEQLHSRVGTPHIPGSNNHSIVSIGQRSLSTAPTIPTPAGSSARVRTDGIELDALGYDMSGYDLTASNGGFFRSGPLETLPSGHHAYDLSSFVDVTGYYHPAGHETPAPWPDILVAIHTDGGPRPDCGRVSDEHGMGRPAVVQW